MRTMGGTGTEIPLRVFAQDPRDLWVELQERSHATEAHGRVGDQALLHKVDAIEVIAPYRARPILDHGPEHLPLAIVEDESAPLQGTLAAPAVPDLLQTASDPGS